ncbi:MAG: hypothetical protein F4X97_09760 [Boseongicola sp. SB0662_bin_57]|nr:hypothetical protein [Boseongicola sp. SB0662_bin_57]
MAQMTAPTTGVKIRMYRQGHGDCFLLAFAGREGRRKRNVHVLIDCGLKPKSEVHGQKIDEIIDDIHEATGGHVDVVIVTHEHQDHVNGFAKKRDKKHLFDKISFGQCWLAWTEDETDDLANALRDRFNDTLLTLALAQDRLGTTPDTSDLAQRLSDLIGTEVGGDDAPQPDGSEGLEITDAFRAARAENPQLGMAQLSRLAVKGITNKRATKYLRDRAEATPVFLSPDHPPAELPHVKDLKVYALGPPRDPELLLDLDPEGTEEFHLRARGIRLAVNGEARGFAAAVAGDVDGQTDGSPFNSRYRIPADKILKRGRRKPLDDGSHDHLAQLYNDRDAAWRRIDDDWLATSEGLALRLNNEVNNTSLVLAIELPKTGKVLLFTGDAQRGSWIGWSDLSWTDDAGDTTTARDLLARCVLYKVGHHGSHNATLDGIEADEHANIGWMARGEFADGFAAMIPANTPWALGKKRPWVHPLPQIEAALEKKARGRVFRTDRDHVPRPPTDLMPDDDWTAFQDRIEEKALYFEYSIEDK